MRYYYAAGSLVFQGRIIIMITIYRTNISQSGNIVKRRDAGTRSIPDGTRITATGE